MRLLTNYLFDMTYLLNGLNIILYLYSTKLGDFANYINVTFLQSSKEWDYISECLWHIFFLIVKMSYDLLVSWLYLIYMYLYLNLEVTNWTKVTIELTPGTYILVYRSLLTPIKIWYVFITAKCIYTSKQVQKPALYWYCEN